MTERICKAPNCDRAAAGRTYECTTHRSRRRIHGSYELPPRKPPARIACSGGGCTAALDAARSKSELCRRCYRRAYYLAKREHERATMAEWRKRNRAYDRQRWNDYYAANAERLKEYTRRRYVEQHEEILAKAAVYREAKRDQISERSAQARRADPNWPLRNRANAHRRRVGADGRRLNFAAILAEHGMTCHLCGGEIADRADLHFDHVIPLARGGEHSADNIRPAHARCNMRKGARIA